MSKMINIKMYVLFQQSFIDILKPIPFNKTLSKTVRGLKIYSFTVTKMVLLYDFNTYWNWQL